MSKSDSMEISELPNASTNIHVRGLLPSINQSSKIKSTILLVDRQYSLLIDLKDDLKENFTDSIGLASYSNSKSRTQSYYFIFDTIWRQAIQRNENHIERFTKGSENILTMIRPLRKVTQQLLQLTQEVLI